MTTAANAGPIAEYKRMKEFYSDPANLSERLRQIDKPGKVNRIFVMGCGRSGTWLLTSLFSTYRSMSIWSEEVHFAHFGLVECRTRNLLLKRNAHSYEDVEKIPPEIGIAYVIRHPFDVLTSHNPTTNRKYHIQPWRWLGEIGALQYLMDTKRERTKIIRYEDLVTHPATQQAGIAEFFGLEIQSGTDQVVNTFKASPSAVSAMHGLREIDVRSVGKYKQDPEKLAYIRTILPRLGRTLDWVASEFGYDITL